MPADGGKTAASASSAQDRLSQHGGISGYGVESMKLSLDRRRSTCACRAAAFRRHPGRNLYGSRQRSPSGSAPRQEAAIDGRRDPRLVEWAAPRLRDLAPRSSPAGRLRRWLTPPRPGTSRCSSGRGIRSMAAGALGAPLASFPSRFRRPRVPAPRAAAPRFSAAPRGAQASGPRLARHGGEPLRAGDLVTTGTLAPALPAGAGERGPRAGLRSRRHRSPPLLRTPERVGRRSPPRGERSRTAGTVLRASRRPGRPRPIRRARPGRRLRTDAAPRCRTSAAPSARPDRGDAPVLRRHMRVVPQPDMHQRPLAEPLDHVATPSVSPPSATTVSASGRTPSSATSAGPPCR